MASEYNVFKGSSRHPDWIGTEMYTGDVEILFYKKIHNNINLVTLTSLIIKKKAIITGAQEIEYQGLINDCNLGIVCLKDKKCKHNLLSCSIRKYKHGPG